MSGYTIINAIANCTTAISAIGLLVHIFGDPDNSIWDDKIKAWLAKVGLTIATCGAVANVLTLSTPTYSEILLNVGMSFTFFWLSWWQFEQFKEKMDYFKPKTRKVSTSRKKKPKTRTRKAKIIRNYYSAD
jgi:hypothetical protein